MGICRDEVCMSVYDDDGGNQRESKNDSTFQYAPDRE